MRNLWPPIDVVESNLNGNAGKLLHFPESEESGSANVDMPEFLREKIRQRVASRSANFDSEPREGQIWRFDPDDARIAPLGVLLESWDNHGWHGWIAASETDYATEKDVLLEPSDEPFDPIAAMIQTWNPVTVDIGKGKRVLAQLSSERLNAIREVGKGLFEPPDVSRPGFVAPLITSSGVSVLAGTPILHPEDPRSRYQELYRRAAARLSIQGNEVPLPQKASSFQWRSVGWSLAASVMLAQTVIIANMMKEKPREELVTEYRSVSPGPRKYAYIEVQFKPDAKQVDIGKLLVKIGGSIVDGPGEFGEYKIKVGIGNERISLETLRNSGLVDNAEATK